MGTAILTIHPNEGGSSQGSLPGKPEQSFCQGNSKEPSDKLTNFPFALFSPPLISFWKSFGEISERAVSATSLLLHHSEHCNIIKLVKRKQWCLSFLQTARCSFQGEAASQALPGTSGGGQDSSFLFKASDLAFRTEKPLKQGFGSLWIRGIWLRVCIDLGVLGEGYLHLPFGRVHPISALHLQHCFQLLKDIKKGIKKISWNGLGWKRP